MKKAVYAAAGLAIVIALVLVATVVIVDVRHPRDERGFLTYLRTYGDTSSDAPIVLPPTKALLAEGDRACDWLGDQSTALWRTSRDYRFPAVYTRYRHSVRHQAPEWGDGALPTRGTVGVAAWAYLCQGTWVLHKPHYVFSDPNPGD